MNARLAQQLDRNADLLSAQTVLAVRVRDSDSKA
jgi:hypothetical protein